MIGIKGSDCMISTMFLNSAFAICGFVMMLLVLIIFFTKKKQWDLQSTLFFLTTIDTLIILGSEIVISYTIINRELYPILNNIMCRIYMFTSIFWFFSSTGYVISMFLKNTEKKKEEPEPEAEPEPAPTPEDIELLREIRDLLKAEK